MPNKGAFVAWPLCRGQQEITGEWSPKKRDSAVQSLPSPAEAYLGSKEPHKTPSEQACLCAWNLRNAVPLVQLCCGHAGQGGNAGETPRLGGWAETAWGPVLMKPRGSPKPPFPPKPRPQPQNHAPLEITRRQDQHEDRPLKADQY